MRCSPIIYFLLAFIFLPKYSFAQTDILSRKQADYFYRHYAFAQAIPFYESITDTALQANIKLADCYRLVNRPGKAAIYYGKAVANNEDTLPETRLHYGQTLMTLGKYDKAEKWLSLYLQKYPSDRRAQNLIASCQTATQRKAATPSGTVTFLSDLNTDKNEFAPTVWKGRLFFASDSAYEVSKKNDTWTGSSFFNIYSASFDSGRKIYGGEISAGPCARKKNIKYHDGPCTFGTDINEMYFTRTGYNRLIKTSKENKDTVALLNIMVATHYDTSKRIFKKIKPFAFNSKAYSTAHPAISPDGRVLIFVSDKKGGAGGFDLYMCKRQADGRWLLPESIGNVINTEGDELFPFLADSKTLYFASDGQKDCFGGLDVYKSTFNGTSWSQPENMGVPVNSSYDDISLAMHDDGRTSFFSSNRPAAKGGDNIYFFKGKQLFMHIDVKDAITKQPVPGAIITLAQSTDTFTASTDISGKYLHELFPKFPYRYKIIAALDGYDTAISASVFYGHNKLTDTVYVSIELKRERKAFTNTSAANTSTAQATQADGAHETGRDQKIFFNLKITDCRTRKPVRDTDVKVNVTFDTNIKRISYYLDKEADDGELTSELFPGKKYMLEVSSFDYKALYLTKINTDFHFNPKGDTVIYDSVCLDEREEVIDLGLIPFDYDSASLNDIAQKRLFKFVRYLNELHPTMKLLIRGHTDCRESKAGYNKILAEKRAWAVRDYLTQHGVKANRLQAAGVKDDMPRVHCNNCEPDDSPEKIIKNNFKDGRTDCGPTEHAQNRYIDCVILKY